MFRYFISAASFATYVSIKCVVSCDVFFDINEIHLAMCVSISMQLILRCMFRYQCSLSCDVCFDINAVYLAMYVSISMQLIL